MITVILKNYRCFPDSAPLRLNIGSGFIALVGPNNSGKSAALRAFLELRPLLSQLCQVQQLQTLSVGSSINAPFHEVQDQLDVFHDSNERALAVELHFEPSAELHIAKVVATTTRESPGRWSGKVYASDTSHEIFGGPNVHAEHFFQTRGGLQIPAPTSALELVRAIANQSLYIGAFRNAISEGSGSYYDMAIGLSFVARWAEWQTGTTKPHRQASLRLTKELARIFGYDSLELSASRGDQTILITANGRSYRLNEVGAGFSQFLIVLANVAIRRPEYLLIDEPELNLHPTLQANFLTTLAAYCPKGIMFATHSLGLARTTAETIYAFARRGDANTVRPFEGLSNLTEFLGEMSYSAFHEMGHDRLLLVEGVSEVRAVQQLLRLVGKDHTTVVLPMGGSALIQADSAHELAELKRLSPRVSVLIDSERAGASEPIAADRAEFVRVCTELGFNTHVLERRAFENYFTEDAIHKAFGLSFRPLQPYEALSSLPSGWNKRENWRICRMLQWSEISETDLGVFIDAL